MMPFTSTSSRPRRRHSSSSITARSSMPSTAAAMACFLSSCVILAATSSNNIMLFGPHNFSAQAATHHSSQPTSSPRRRQTRRQQRQHQQQREEEGSRHLRSTPHEQVSVHHDASANRDHRQTQSRRTNNDESELEPVANNNNNNNNNNNDDLDYTSVVQVGDYPITTSFTKKITSESNSNSNSNSSRNLQQQQQQILVTKTHLTPSSSCNPQTHQPFSFHFQTDNYGSETSWYLREQPSLLANGGIIGKYLGFGPPTGYAYGDLTIYTYSYCLEIGKVYVLSVEDDFGDGLCCERGYGGYELVIGGARVYSTEYGDTFNEFVEHVFEVKEGVYTSSPSGSPVVASTATTTEDGPTWAPTDLNEPACEWSNPEICGCAPVNLADYRGNLSVTESGHECMEWSSQSPHAHPYLPESFRGSNLVGNYCRNPNGNDARPWCFTTDPNIKWEYCAVPVCGEETSAITAAPRTLAPTASPMVEPTASPVLPTQIPSSIPSSPPSMSPTMAPTRQPTNKPTNGYHIYNPSNGCYGGDVHVRVEVQADEFSTDTSWEIHAPNGTKVLHEAAGSFAQFETRSQEICLPHGIYNFSIYDVYGDGICCRYGLGYYRVYLDGYEVLNGGSFNEAEHSQLNIGFEPFGYMTEREHQYLEAHNYRRKEWHERYNETYVPLRYSPELAKSSKAWAEELLYACGIVGIEHESVNLFGENLAKNTGGNGWGQLYPPDNIVGRWVDFEIGLPYPSNGHLTQALWRASKYLGCGESVKKWRGGFCRVQVCRYGRAGNCDMAHFNSTEGENWLPPMLEAHTRCGPNCPPEGCF